VEAEEEAFERNEEARARRITAHPLVQMSEIHMQLGVRPAQKAGTMT
jgi:hypothetical protein